VIAYDDEMVNASSGDEPHLPLHVRDEWASIAALPLHRIPEIDRTSACAVHLSLLPATIWIPWLADAETMETPDDRWQGWSWESSRPRMSLQLNVDRDEHLPRLGASHVQPHDQRVEIAGHSFGLRLQSQHDGRTALHAYFAVVYGFLDEHTQFWGQAIAPSIDERCALLEAIGSITFD
jgi:hypothetical protein